MSEDAAPPPATSLFGPLVALVGAGPGDPGLITVAGVARLAEADVVVYDRLANPALLAHTRPGAELIYAGKMPDRHTLSQDEINALLIARAREGKRVVRLKGGDPFVFGRGSEEAEALVAAGISFEVIPGVTSAIAVPAYAGIPVTHRGLASSFAVITGHDAEDGSHGDRTADTAGTDWQRIANLADTLVVLMGAARLHEIARGLIAAGRDPATPAAVVERGTTPRQRTVTGTLSTIAEAAAAAGIEPPAITIVGAVAALRDRLRWFDTWPLFGKRVLVTRTRHQASDLSRALAAQGADCIELPTIEIVPAHDKATLAAAIARLRSSGYGRVIFTSANGVRIFADHLQAGGIDARAFARTQIAAIGPGTADALASRGLRADIVPGRYIAEGLLEALSSRVMRGQRVLLPRAEGARDLLVRGLTHLGAHVDEVILYRADVPEHPDTEALQQLRDGGIDIATFASSSSVRNLIAMLAGDASPLRAMTIAAIGPITAQAVRDAGLEPQIIAEEHTIDGLVRALVDSAAGAKAIT